MLEGYGIRDFVDGTNPCHSQFMFPSFCDSGVASSGFESRIESDAYKVWKMHDRALMQLITATLSSMAISCAISSSSARELWVRLQEQFSTVSKTSIFQLKSDLQTIKKGADLVTQYLQRIKEARDYLAAAEVMFADEDIVILALNGLPAEYNIFQCVIRGRENVISLKEFHAQLLAEETLIENTSTTQFLSAMVVKNSDMDHNVVASSGFHRNSKVHGSSGYNGFSGQTNFYNGGNRSKYKDKGKTFNNQGQRHYNNQGQRYYNLKPVIHDFSLGILGSPSQFHDGGSSSTIICQLCSHQGHIAANCAYRSNDVSENC
ncbi:hypothetical protein ACFX13_009171 [Malus domestica]